MWIGQECSEVADLDGIKGNILYVLRNIFESFEKQEQKTPEISLKVLN